MDGKFRTIRVDKYADTREGIISNIEYFDSVKKGFLAQAKAAEELELDYRNRLLDLDRQDQI